MPFRNSALAALLLAATVWGNSAGYEISGSDPGPWPRILGSIGLFASVNGSVMVARAGAADSPEWLRRVEEGGYLILEGESPLASKLGFLPETPVTVASMVDVHAPGLPLIFETPVALRRFALPQGAIVFAKDRWSAAPLMAGLRRGKGALLWIGTSPGAQGYERFSYLPQALMDLGFRAPFRSQRTWAFFDYSYRTRVDLDYFAAKWKKTGISALHVAAWHFYEPDPERDAYLHKLVEACHREGILVYAWLELPHVSEKFWNDHPAWREKTAVLQDAALDWRKLMNLANPDCFREVSRGVNSLVSRFDWDGVNLAELYFESLEGAANPARFTPMSDEVRKAFQKESGFDPILLWSERKDVGSLRAFLNFRATLAQHMQEQWVAEIEKCRRLQPDLDIVLTHVDDRLDRGMRDAIGADSARTLPLLDRHKMTFLVEDPATVWNLGPGRYPEIARRYPESPRLAVDINIVERYQDVYPTKRQTGIELFELVHAAAQSFPRVALYFENSILDQDLPLLPSAAAVVTRYQVEGERVTVNSPHGFLLPWNGAARLDGAPWAGGNGSLLQVPSGPHVIEPDGASGSTLVSLNGELFDARRHNGVVEISYSGGSRVPAQWSCEVARVWVDGQPVHPNRVGRTLLLPAGSHRAAALCK